MLLLVFLCLSFLTLPRNPLQNDDAALYALAAKNAIIHQQWLAQFITPGDQASFFDKPPLGIWLLAWLPKLIGLNQLTIHLPNVIYYCLTLFFIFIFLKQLACRRVAFYSTLIAATSLCLVVYSRSPKLDILLTLFVLSANFSLLLFWQKNQARYLFYFTFALAAGFLTKSGFGLLLPGLTALTFFIINPEAREKSWRFIFSFPGLGCFLLLVSLISGVLALQALPLKEQWLPYLKAIMIQSKYNTSYLGWGINTSTIGFLLVTIFPWTPLAFSQLRIRCRSLTLADFCNIWFWSNFLFLLFLYRQNDLRTFTVLVPPLAALAGIRLAELQSQPRRKLSETIWALFFLGIFVAILAGLFISPKNPQGFDISAAIIPVSFFVIVLLFITLYLNRPSRPLLIGSFALVVTAYSLLFYFTLPLADALNPDVTWPSFIKERQAIGYQFFIYRPPDRQLFFSPDLFYVDFMAGPADRYFWQKNELLKALKNQKTVLLSDTQSYERLDLKLTRKVIAQDNYSCLTVVN